MVKKKYSRKGEVILSMLPNELILEVADTIREYGPDLLSGIQRLRENPTQGVPAIMFSLFKDAYTDEEGARYMAHAIQMIFLGWLRSDFQKTDYIAILRTAIGIPERTATKLADKIATADDERGVFQKVTDRIAGFLSLVKGQNIDVEKLSKTGTNIANPDMVFELQNFGRILEEDVLRRARAMLSAHDAFAMAFTAGDPVGMERDLNAMSHAALGAVYGEPWDEKDVGGLWDTVKNIGKKIVRSPIVKAVANVIPGGAVVHDAASRVVGAMDQPKAPAPAPQAPQPAAPAAPAAPQATGPQAAKTGAEVKVPMEVTTLGGTQTVTVGIPADTVSEALLREKK